jgi:hypothetical protein
MTPTIIISFHEGCEVVFFVAVLALTLALGVTFFAGAAFFVLVTLACVAAGAATSGEGSLDAVGELTIAVKVFGELFVS